jgi:hypothetical protein
MARKLLSAWVCLLVFWCGCVVLASGHDDDPRPTPRPVRSSTRWGTHLIAEGCRRSAILAELVNSLTGRKVIVYVQPSVNLPPATDGYLSFAGESGGYRYLRVIINPRLPQLQLLVTLAHELQHVREVAGAADVVDQESFKALFARIGHANRNGYDTPAARRIGNIVWSELESGRVLPVQAGGR